MVLFFYKTVSMLPIGFSAPASWIFVNGIGATQFDIVDNETFELVYCMFSLLCCTSNSCFLATFAKCNSILSTYLSPHPIDTSFPYISSVKIVATASSLNRGLFKGTTKVVPSSLLTLASCKTYLSSKWFLHTAPDFDVSQRLPLHLELTLSNHNFSLI